METLCYLNEIWQDIPEFEGKYQGSNIGRVKSLNYNHTGKEQILKPSKNKDGYLVVNLYKNGKVKYYLVHRLVWMAFNGSIPEGLEINHKSEVKTENNLENLELVTRKENNNYGTHNERIAKTLTNRKDLSKSVLQYDKQGNLIKEWCSLMEVERQLGFANGNISKCCNGRRKTANGYVWKYQ